MQEQYLEHHGVKGQKWGVRRYQNYDGSLINSNKKRQLNRETKEYRKHLVNDMNFTKKLAKKESNDWKKDQLQERGIQNGLSDNKKKALKVGAAVAGVALAAYGNYKIYDFAKNAGVLSAGENFIKNSLIRNIPIDNVETSNTSAKSFELAKSFRDAKSIKSETTNKSFELAKGFKNEKSLKPLNSNKTSNIKKLSDFDFDVARRMKTDGNVIDVAIPKDKHEYADSFAKQMSRKPGDYAYYYDYMINKLK